MNKWIYILVFQYIATVSFAQYYVEYNSQIEQAYNHIINLDFDKAEEVLEKIEQSEFDNLARLHIENYIDFFTIFIFEEEEEFKSRKKNKDRRLKLIEKMPDSDPYKRFISSEIKLQWALLSAKFNELFQSSKNIYSAYKTLEDNVQAHPDFVYSYKSLSVIHALAESVKLPGIFKDIFGIRGDIATGVREIESVLAFRENEDFIFGLESDAIYAFILFYQSNEKERAIEYMMQSDMSVSSSPLASFVIAKLLQRHGDNQEALNILEAEISKTSVEEFPFLYFMMGIAKLRSLDPEADMYLNAFLEHFNGQHYIKEAYQKMAWSKLVFQNDFASYKKYMDLCVDKGEALIDDDKQALREAEQNNIPNPILLKARLLFDGGYYQKAYSLMVQHAHEFYFNEQLSIEYFYRLGRICQSLKNFKDAIDYFESTRALDPHQTNYMSCNAALQMGIIYESQGDVLRAKQHFKSCLSMSPSEYKQSLHQKAKAGLSRIK